MTKIEYIREFFDNPTEARQFFREKIIGLVSELKELRVWLKGWAFEMSSIENEMDRIIGLEAIRITDQYQMYESKMKELDNIRLYYKMSLIAFTDKHHTGYKEDTSKEKYEIAKAKPILEVAGHYVNIKLNKAVCPFHPDKAPSMHFYPGTNSFFCFGACNSGGDVIDFVKKIEGVDFAEAVKILNE